ncbi:hypothetical protein B9Z65_5630 [Elsinoe australis]|uniref:BTB domain-containing protein n=1 Tax=Elsinoe australis TaxID=40998 RepID=A0A2P7Z3B8_9PEZI|nr:hypothetical protein B9Z65_5630 [Elsinoe australis]
MVLHHLEPGRISIKYFDKEKLSDITIVVSERQIKVHRLVLASQSPYFEALCNGKFQDGSLPEVELIGDDHDDVHDMIKYMYTENIDWSAEDIRSGKEPVSVGLMVIADKYQFENLVGKVMAYLNFVRDYVGLQKQLAMCSKAYPI